MPYKYSEKSKAQVWGSICNQYDWQDTLKMGAGFSFYKNAWRHENETWLVSIPMPLRVFFSWI
jgi:hypothetical protein